MPILMRYLFVTCVFIGSLLTSLSAHDPGFSTARAKHHSDSLQVEIILSIEEANSLDSLYSKSGPDDKEPYQSLAAEVFKVSSDDGSVVPTELAVATDDEEVAFSLSFPLPQEGWLELSAPLLRDLSFGHRQYFLLTGTNGEVIAEQLWGHSNHTFRLKIEPASRQPTETTRTSLWSFLFVGMQHIFIGFDHILFLFGLLLVCRDFRSAAIVITAFTVAHSITLGLATFNFVRLPSGFVEPVIAVSIIYVGLENLWRKGNPRNRWPLVFVFGLVHGLGFAGELRATGIGDGSLTSVIAPLLSFNIGVELGQVVIAAIALPTIWYLRRKPAFLRSGVAYCSAGIVLFGIFWLLERTVLG